MANSRIEQALARIEAAMTRVETARGALADAPVRPAADPEAPGSARILALINNHERLREEVADTMRDLDTLIEELEG